MKVWGKEVSCCNECTYFYKDGDILECATDELKHLKSLDKVEYKMYAHEDCPFSKPITKEVIESFGFQYSHSELSINSPDFYFRSWIKNRDEGTEVDCYSLLYYPDKRLIIQLVSTHTPHLLFNGKVYNKLELKFILKSLGIIK